MSVKKQGFLQALGITVYCFLVGLFFWNANSIFGKMDTFLSPILFLLLLSISVLVCAFLVLFKPYKLFINNKKKEALNIVASTLIWLLGFLVLLFTAMLVVKQS